MNNILKILIADDNNEFVERMKIILEQSNSFKVFGLAKNDKEKIEIIVWKSLKYI